MRGKGQSAPNRLEGTPIRFEGDGIPTEIDDSYSPVFTVIEPVKSHRLRRNVVGIHFAPLRR